MDSIQPGMRVKVPFGRRNIVGIVVEIASHSTLPSSQLKSALEVLDETPLIPDVHLSLLRWASEYYHHPLGEVMVNTLPRWFREGKSSASLSSPRTHSPLTEKPHALRLNAEQWHAVETLIQARGFQSFLLEGVTGSGKTEVYLQVIDALLARHQSALVLVPEIALTPQTVQRFRARFSVPVAVLHSGLTDKQRALAWEEARCGHVSIVIGTRSAVFTPMPTLGIIILDEEHDASFKQQSGFRYSARDCAVRRAQLENIPVLLGSATPSLESLYNVERKRYHALTLPQRAGTASLPSFTWINLRDQPLKAGLSPALIEKMRTHLHNQGQVALFLNRRGYAPVLMCHHCGWMAECERCDARLTYHAQFKKLRCHHCEAIKPVPTQCPTCKGHEILKVGQGTERLEEAVKTLFPEYTLMRLDRDTTRRKGSLQTLLTAVMDQKAQILIGTQMLAKGHHFPHLSLVAIVDADSGLFSLDFRALERMGQLMMQVAGRAGRAEKPGEVVVQTHYPDHPALRSLITEGYGAFARALLAERQAAHLPPCAYRARLHAESPHPDKPIEFLNKIKELTKKQRGLELLGPMASTLPKKAGKYQAEMILQSNQRIGLHSQLNHWLTVLAQNPLSRSVRWVIEMDA